MIPNCSELVQEMVTDVCFALTGFEKEARRQAAEERLSASEEACRLSSSAVQASANGIMITELRANEVKLSYVNPAFERITGYTAAEVLGMRPGLSDGGRQGADRRPRNRPGHP